MQRSPACLAGAGQRRPRGVAPGDGHRRSDEEIAGALEASAQQSQSRGGHASAASAYERAAELSERESLPQRAWPVPRTAAWHAGQAERASGLINRVPADAVPSERARLSVPEGIIEGRRGWL